MTEAMRVGVRPGDPGTLTVRFWAGARAAAGTDRVSMPVGTVNAVAVVTAANLGLRYEAQYRWTSLITDVTDLAYPS